MPTQAYKQQKTDGGQEEPLRRGTSTWSQDRRLKRVLWLAWPSSFLGSCKSLLADKLSVGSQGPLERGRCLGCIRKAVQSKRLLPARGRRQRGHISWQADLGCLVSAQSALATTSRARASGPALAAFSLTLRFAKYYRDLAGHEQRTLIKAYGIRFDIIVFGKVGPPLNPTGRGSLPPPYFLPSPHFGSLPILCRLGSLTSYLP